VSDSLGPDEVTRLTDPMVMRAQTRVGQVLKEKWRLDVLLGVGGMAAVYAATHRNGSRVAIKLLHPELSTHHQVRTRFLREGYVANAVSHEGAVRVSDDDVAEDGAAFLVMELLEGETLEDRRVRSGGRLDEDEVLSVTDQLLDVLIAAHAKGVIHRDIKPDNVFVTRTGQVKVLDFGIARLREVTSKSTATVSGATMGTPAFMPPEQARGLWDEVDGRSDLWAVGATMFNLLAGQVVHEGRTANESLVLAPWPEDGLGQLPAVSEESDFMETVRTDRVARLESAAHVTKHGATSLARQPIGTTSPLLTAQPSGQRVVVLAGHLLRCARSHGFGLLDKAPQLVLLVLHVATRFRRRAAALRLHPGQDSPTLGEPLVGLLHAHLSVAAVGRDALDTVQPNPHEPVAHLVELALDGVHAGERRLAEVTRPTMSRT
jgi:serine/threonine-protein kinase